MSGGGEAGRSTSPYITFPMRKAIYPRNRSSYLHPWAILYLYPSHASLRIDDFSLISIETTPIMATVPTYQDLAAKKRAEQLSLIPSEWRFAEIPSVDSAPDALPYIRKCLTPAELALTEETDITILLRKLSSGGLSSLELTRAFAKRAALAHQLTTCCTEILFEDAFATAAKLDEYLDKTGRTIGPLHGLPVSIKDLFSVKGVDTSIGMSPPLLPPSTTTNSNQDGSDLQTTQPQPINPSPEPSAASAPFST